MLRIEKVTAHDTGLAILMVLGKHQLTCILLSIKDNGFKTFSKAHMCWSAGTVADNELNAEVY